ncbi:histidine kinase [Sphingomonas sp. MG17]|uniref:Histidine kinase n=1 Tax=Sphingomonas tagetis TaxID=2949092 RepID=A0A9X2KMG4_9SPHN|nr:histidine kinase [Sphingomonas tagetis]MCP3731785.1 histidine kinase [Sphingomonas tagetis]
MWRYFAGGVAALLMAGAGVFLFQSRAAPEALPPAPPAAQVGNGSEAVDEALPALARIPRASDRTREQKRFDRYDKDRSDGITLAELMEPRRKAFAKLDRDRDGRLSFEEWAVRGMTRFAGADVDKSAVLSRAEFATTAPKRKAAAAPKCDCREAVAKALAEAEE